jgi:hypothetical protein
MKQIFALFAVLGLAVVQAVGATQPVEPTGNDVVVLKDGHLFRGDVEHVYNCAIRFAVGDAAYEIPAQDIAEVYFGNPESRAARRMTEVIADADACFTGKTDAEHHGHGVGHFATGFLFGPFGVIGCAVAKRTPYKSNSPELITVNQSMWSDPAYLACYNKGARSKAVTTSALGWATWILILIL